MPRYELPDHPTIRSMELRGYPTGMTERIPTCPVCGEECEDYYRDRTTLEILGCENCIEKISAYDVMEMEEQS